MFRRVVSIIFLSCSFVWAGVELPALFSDGMVLQQGIKVPVWGWAATNEEVRVEFKGQSKSAQSAMDGKWMVYLDPLEASSDGSEMRIKVGADSLIIQDVLVGEVWICSGQSNMDWTLGRLSTNAKNPKYQPIVKHIRKEVAEAEDPLLRQIEVPKRVSAFEEKNRFEGEWISSSPDANKNFTATGYFFARELRRELDVPVGLLKCAWGGTRIEPWIPMSSFKEDAVLKDYYEKELSQIRKALVGWDDEAELEKHRQKVAKWKENHSGWKWQPDWVRLEEPLRPDQPNTVPSTLYNGMLHALVPYAVKGAIWYQGEANAKYFPKDYRNRFETMVSGWRAAWGQGDFPVYYAQLASFKDKSDEEAAGWSVICNQQRLSLEVENTGMAVLNDIGEKEDIHPRNKIDVGKRLSLWALAKDYGRKDLVHSGPLFKDAAFADDKVLISFDSVGEGLMVGSKNLMEPAVEVDESVGGFQICGSDRMWMWADATIVSKNQVEVSHPDVSGPIEVRYAWSMNAEGANLYNRSGLPASIFKCSKSSDEK